MEITKAEQGYNTNLASEFLVMSMLSRVGIDAYLSLGNKKGVDIIVTSKDGSVFIVEVKGVNKRYDWPIGNTGSFPQSPNLFYCLMCFNGEIGNLQAVPDFWLIPSAQLGRSTEHKIANNDKTVYISNKKIREEYSQYKNTLKALTDCLVQDLTEVNS